jgi:beta-glucanase (GH16 family)
VVTFNAAEGIPSQLEVTVEKGTRVPRPANIVREGFVIDGWFSNESLTQSYNFNSNVNNNINLYARWAATTEDGRIYINALAAYPLRGAPVTGNYPQALFRFPFTGIGGSRVSYIQTLEWDPPVEKVFAASTAYTATYTFEPLETHAFGELSLEKVSGLPEGAGVQVSGARDGEKYKVTIKYDATGASKGERKLLFEDNFGGSDVDGDKWNKSTSANRHDLSVWEPDMVSVANDSLIIGMKIDPTIDKGTFPGKWIRAGAVTSSRLFESTYGYFEARIKYPPAYNGMNLPWGAFWLNGRTTGLSPYGGKMGTEVDVVEFIHNKRPCFNSALHWDGYNYEDGSHQSVGKESVQDLGQGKTKVQFDAVDVYDDNFHTFAFDWSPEGYKFIIDGFLFWEVKEGSRHYWDGANRTVGVCQNPLYMLFSIEAAPWSNFPQGTWPLGWPGDKMEIKSVRVWNQPPETPPIIP